MTYLLSRLIMLIAKIVIVHPGFDQGGLVEGLPVALLYFKAGPITVSKLLCLGW